MVHKEFGGKTAQAFHLSSLILRDFLYIAQSSLNDTWRTAVYSHPNPADLTVPVFVVVADFVAMGER